MVLNVFPALSETFVLAELLELERAGVRLHVIALVKLNEPLVQESVRRLQAPVEYLPERDTRLAAARAAHLRLVWLKGWSYLTAVRSIRKTAGYSLNHLAQAVTLADRLVSLSTPPVYVHFGGHPATVVRSAVQMVGGAYGLSVHARDVWTTDRSELTAAVRAACVVHACTTEAWNYVRSLAAPGTPVRLLHHGVAVPLTVPVGTRHQRRTADRPIILTVGRLVAKKGHSTLLRAASELKTRGVEFSLRIVGDGPEWGVLQRQVHELALSEYVSFRGPLTTGEVEAEYRLADIFALACRQLPDGDRDGMPNTMLEAMAWGLPVVGTTLPGLVELVGASGLLVRPDDALELANVLESLIVDPSLRAALGADGHARVRERFNRSLLIPGVHESLARAGLLDQEPASDRQMRVPSASPR